MILSILNKTKEESSKDLRMLRGETYHNKEICNWREKKAKEYNEKQSSVIS